MIVISTHAVFLKNKDVYGPPHAVSLFLNKRKIDHIFIKHRLEGNGFSRVEYYKKGKLIRTIERGYPKRLPFFLQYVFELLLSLKITIQDAKGCEMFIGVDPLNAFSGNLLKTIRKTKKTVFFSADFSLKRFETPILNNFYLFLDKLAMFWSDYAWSVSRRIQEYRRKQHLQNKKNLLLPNAPFFNDIKRIDYSKINKYDLVIVSALEKGIEFELLLDVLFEIRKSIAKVRLIIIGSGSEEERIRNYVIDKNLSGNVKFLGALSHEKMFKVLTKSALGIALYKKSDKKHFRYYSDPMKVRDYLASGLPTIISGNSGIGLELEKRNAGKIVKIEKKEIVDALKNIFKNHDLYLEMRKNAIELAKRYDTYNLLEKYLNY